MPQNEIARLNALRSYELLDTVEEEIYDQLTTLASKVCGTPISLISLVDQDRQWFKSHVGLAARETTREESFCAHSIVDEQPLIVKDARQDDRFHDNPLVVGDTNLVFYAGIPLIDNEGYALGTLCVIDHQPRELTPEQMTSLRILAKQIVTQFHLRRELTQKRQFAEQLSRFAAQVPGVIYQFRSFTDGTSCFPLASEAIQSIYEVTPEQVRFDASPVLERLHPEDYQKVVDSITQSAKTLENWSCDYRVILPKAGVRWLRGFARPEKLPDQSTLWHGFISDITEQKNLEEQMMHKSKMAALGEMASGVAHEINNPVAIIVGKASLMRVQIQRNMLSPQTLSDDLQKIEATGMRIAHIVKGLSTFARNADHDPKVSVHLATVIEDALSLVGEKLKSREIDLRLNIPDHLSLECNATQLAQIILNLVKNSKDAIAELSERWIEISAHEEDDSILISVMDSGNGIPQDVQAKMMHPFFSTKPFGQGTGLGLSLSKGLVESHHGELSYDAQSHHTRFVVRLPRVQPLQKAA